MVYTLHNLTDKVLLIGKAKKTGVLALYKLYKEGRCSRFDEIPCRKELWQHDGSCKIRPFVMGGFDKGDPRVAELKDARSQYNRKDKYGIAYLMGYSPQDANEMYRRQNSGVLREHARPTYKTMYPISDMAHAVTGSGGLTGMLLNQAFGKSKKAGKSFFDDLRQMGGDMIRWNWNWWRSCS